MLSRAYKPNTSIIPFFIVYLTIIILAQKRFNTSRFLNGTITMFKVNWILVLTEIIGPLPPVCLQLSPKFYAPILSTDDELLLTVLKVY